MALFKLFRRMSRESTRSIATNMSLGAWCAQSTESSRFVQKVELCTALCTGEDAWGTPLAAEHYHTLVRVTLEPARRGQGISEDTLLVERVHSTQGAYHSVTPISEPLSNGGTPFYPDVHDRVCAIAEGSSTAFAGNLAVERKLKFDDGALSLAQFCKVLGFVAETTRPICKGGDCKFQSRAFGFTILAGLAPALPPREVGEESAPRVSWSGSGMTIDDSTFELSAQTFLTQVVWLVPRDVETLDTLKLMAALKDESRTNRTRARLYH